MGCATHDGCESLWHCQVLTGSKCCAIMACGWCVAQTRHNNETHIKSNDKHNLSTNTNTPSSPQKKNIEQMQNTHKNQKKAKNEHTDTQITKQMQNTNTITSFPITCFQSRVRTLSPIIFEKSDRRKRDRKKVIEKDDRKSDGNLMEKVIGKKCSEKSDSKK